MNAVTISWESWGNCYSHAESQLEYYSGDEIKQFLCEQYGIEKWYCNIVNDACTLYFNDDCKIIDFVLKWL